MAVARTGLRQENDPPVLPVLPVLLVLLVIPIRRWCRRLVCARSRQQRQRKFGPDQKGQTDLFGGLVGPYDAGE